MHKHAIFIIWTDSLLQNTASMLRNILSNLSKSIEILLNVETKMQGELLCPAPGLR